MRKTERRRNREMKETQRNKEKEDKGGTDDVGRGKVYKGEGVEKSGYRRRIRSREVWVQKYQEDARRKREMGALIHHGEE